MAKIFEKKEKEKPIEKRQRYFRTDRVEQKKKEGWKVIETIKDEAIRKAIARNQDLVLMEK